MESLVQGMLSNAVAVTVLAVLIAILGRTWRRPAWIHGLCLLAMLKLVTPPMVSLAVPIPSTWRTPASPVEASEPIDTAEVDRDPDLEMMAAGMLADLDTIVESELPTDLPEDDRSEAVVPVPAWRWELLVLGVVLAGAMAWWLLAVVRIIRFHRVLRDVEPMPADWQTQLTDLAARLALRRSPAVCLVPGEVPPMLWTVGKRPRLLLPSRLWSTLAEEQRAAPGAPRAGPFEAPRSLGPVVRARGGRAVLVASRRLVDPSYAARGRRTVLRRLGCLGDAARSQDVCHRPDGGP